METVRKFAKTWAEEPESLSKDVIGGLSDADWSALMVRVIESLPSPGGDDEQVRRLDALARLIGLRAPLPDQPALIAMRQRFHMMVAGDSRRGGGALDKALDALTAQSPPPPAPVACWSGVDPASPSASEEKGSHQRTGPRRRRRSGKVRELTKKSRISRVRPQWYLPFNRGNSHRFLTGSDDVFVAELFPSPEDEGSPAESTQPGSLGGKSHEKVDRAKSKPRSWLANIEQQDREAPLEVGVDYVVSFDVGTTDQPHLAAAQFQERSLSGSDVTVQLSSNDFDIRSDPIQTLTVPRRGATPGPARFLVGARRPGIGTLTATVHSSGNFVTLLHFTVWAARKGSTSLTVVGRAPEGLTNLEPRDISLTLERDGRDAGYNCHIVTDGSAAPPVYLAITPEGLAQEVDALQKALMEVVRTLDSDGREVFQAAVQISKEHEHAALRTMAHAGARLFREIFFGDSSGPGSQNLGAYLRSAANDTNSILTLQVVNNEAPIPWALLYVGDVHDGARLKWDKFLGLRHLIEQLPLAELGPKRTKSVPSTPQLTVGLNVNLNVDKRLTSEVAEHQAHWSEMVKQRTRLEIITRNSSADVLEALANKKNADQIVYFYCHATSKGVDGDTGNAAITMEPNGRMTLEDLKRNAGRNITLAGHPLVFINACESADLTPLFYTGFVPYFMGKGARGVIGTQCKTPALLAIKCGELFFDRLLDGRPVGQSMLETRRELLDVYRNPLGLLYAVHCDVDTLIVPPLVVKPP